jgi:hypothetical protein
VHLTRVVWVALIGAWLGFGQAQPEQKPAEQKQAKPEAAKSTAARDPKAGAKPEGIKVHGHWVLEIRNPDGSVASRKEFENALAPGSGNGAYLISGLFNGTFTAGPWVAIVSVNTQNLQNPVLNLSTAQTAGGCAVAVSNGPCASSLQATINGAGQIVLQGTTPAATASGVLQSVATNYLGCAPNISTQSCLGSSISGFSYGGFLTSATTPAGMSIQAGQDIAVTVTISFS